MSDCENQMAELSKKITVCIKNVKALMEMAKTLTEKFDKPVVKSPEEKQKIDKIFEKKQIGRPVGDYQTKRKQYHKMLQEGKIKEPKKQTLLYYKIFKDYSNDTYILREN